jgi:5-methylcytosine-specific restriction endonuclease McrA
MNCTNCGVPLVSKWQKKYCSRSCSAKVSNKIRTPPTEEVKKQTSISLKKYYKNNKPRSSGIEHAKKVGASTKGKYKKEVNSLLELSKRTTAKLIKRLNLKCCICGWDEASLDIHHIIPRKAGGSDDHNNLTAICPNHHRLAHAGKIDKNAFVTLQELLVDSWRDLYFG